MDAQDNKELGLASYWDRRYTKQSGAEKTSTADKDAVSSHEWFRSYKQLERFFEEKLAGLPSDKTILHLGCGDSTLPADFNRLGYTRQICLDFSTVVINQMKERYADLAGIEWMEMDVRDITLAKGSVDLAIDKGTLDAFLHGSLWSPPDDVRENVQRYVDCVVNVLANGARWIYITYRQPHFMKPLLIRNEWDLVVESLDDEKGGFEYFALIMTKHA